MHETAVLVYCGHLGQTTTIARSSVIRDRGYTVSEIPGQLEPILHAACICTRIPCHARFHSGLISTVISSDILVLDPSVGNPGKSFIAAILTNQPLSKIRHQG